MGFAEDVGEIVFEWNHARGLLVGGFQRDEHRAMIGGLTPVRDDGDEALILHPFLGHAGAEENVINARIGIFHAVEMRPRFIAREVTRIGGIGQIVAGVLFGRAGVHEFIFAGADDFLDGFGVIGVVEIAEHDNIGGGI